MRTPWESSNSLKLGLGTFALATLLTPGPLQGADVYSCENLMGGSLLNGQDFWIEQPGQGAAVVALDAGINGTKVLRPNKTGISDSPAYMTRTNTLSFSFVPFTGLETNAVIQFEATGDYTTMFALGRDLNGDGLLLASDGEMGPAFGVFGRNLRIQEASLGPAYDDGFNEGGGDGNSNDEWYRIQLRMDFTAAEGDGVASLYFMNLSDGDTGFHTVSGMRNRPLGLGRLSEEVKPARWNALWLNLAYLGNNVPSADNFVPNLKGILISEVVQQGDSILLSWRGGVGPYQVQRCTNLVEGAWSNVGLPTPLTNATVEISGAAAFLRIAAP